MKKVETFLMTIFLFISLEKMFQTVRSLKVVNAIDDVSKKAFVRTSKMKKKKSFFLGTGQFFFGGRDRSGKVIVLMSTANPNPVITATISAPDAVEGKATLAESIRDKGASTTYVTIPPSQLLALTPLIKNLRDAVGVAAVDYAWNELNAKLKLIMRIVQDAMDANKPQSVIICIHYGFHPKGRGGSHAQIFSGETGAMAGSIDLIFPIGADGCCYDVKFWNSTRTAFTRGQPSDVGHAHFDGLVSGAMQSVSVAEIRHGLFVRESQIIDVRAK